MKIETIVKTEILMINMKKKKESQWYSFFKVLNTFLKYFYWKLILQWSVCWSGSMGFVSKACLSLQQLQRSINFVFHKCSYNSREKLQESIGTHKEKLKIVSDSLSTCTDISAGIQVYFFPCLSTAGIWPHPTGKKNMFGTTHVQCKFRLKHCSSS